MNLFGIKKIWLFGGLCLLMAGCYEPKEGCLDLAAVKFDADADNPCADCCVYPKLSLVFLHQVVLPTQPDTFFSVKYNTPYPSPFDTTHYFELLRSRYFITDIKLVRDNGEEVGVIDSIQLEAPAGIFKKVESNFAKVDRDIFSANSIGTFITKGIFTKVKFALGLRGDLPQTIPSSVPDGHPLSIKSDTLIYETGVGYIPNLLVFRPDSLPTTDSLRYQLTEVTEISLPFSQPFEVLPGFNLKLTLKVNYMAWFEGIDFKNDSPATIREKITGNLPKAFSVSEIKLE